ncbi:hypothetical protein [uncultured Methanofollis sp.]|uniref:hypothetical protein n=1 Tax=uncultured Methanofollis sp. TaxID=262500 RepID=UPI002621432B|nr:hypothetical protein [uncultured Methanofollis sp.]
MNTRKKTGGILAGVFILLLSIAASGCIGSGTDVSQDLQAEVDEANQTPLPTETLPSPAPTPEEEEVYAFPTIVPVADPLQETMVRTFPTKFEKKTYSIEVAVNGSIYEGVRDVDRRWPTSASWGDPASMTAYYRRYIEDPAMKVFFDDLTRPFRYIRAADGLNDGEYLELLITFVQQIPYDPDAPSNPRYPVEVIGNMKGDCDEKSLLLLGMLAHEGYDTALLLFPGEHHAAAGIGISVNGNPSFRVFTSPDGGKYFYIESTGPTYIGRYTEPFGSAKAFVVPLSNGTKRFDRVNYVTRITGVYQKIDDRLPYMSARMEEWRGEIDDLKESLMHGTYETREAWDRDHRKYTALIRQHNDYVQKFNRYIEVRAYIADHSYDMAGVYRYIQNSNVEDITI